MDKIFKLKEHHTDVKTEILAGLTTFMTMAYVLAVQPGAIVGAEATITDCNGDVISKSAILVMCALVSGLVTILMAFYANMPHRPHHRHHVPADHLRRSPVRGDPLRRHWPGPDLCGLPDDRRPDRD